MQWMIRLVATGLLLALTATGGVAFAQVPQTLNYQGYLTDSSGQALEDSVIVEFSIYAVDTGGVPLWSEFQSVFPSQGLFSTTLGNPTNPFPAGLFQTPLFLGIKVSTDAEMTPRAALSSAAYSIKAEDASTLGGFTPAALNQSSEVALLNSDLSSTQVEVTTLQTAVGQLDSDLAVAQSNIGTNTSELGDLSGSITAIESDVASAQADITVIETTLPNKQNRVNGVCTSGTFMNSVFESGTVGCATDDDGPWLTNSISNPYVSGVTRIGIGTSAPAAALQIDAPVDTDPFRARVQSSTKLRVHTNGSVSVGTSSAGPENGLYVSGFAGVGMNSPLARLGVADPLWQMQIDNNDTGGEDWFMGSSATGWAIGGGKFVISPTDSSTNSALVIDGNKDIGIGVTDPLTRLHLGGGTDVSATGGGYLTIGAITGANIAVDSNEIMARSNGAVASLNLNVEGGEVRINTGGTRDHDSLEVRGRVYFDNGGNGGMRISATDSSPTNALFESTLYEEGLLGFSGKPFWRVYSREFYAQTPLQYKTYSDRSLKSNIVRIDSALEKITALEGVSYSLSRSPMGERKRPMSAEEQFVNDNQVGFIAQDVAKVLPQLVTEDESSGLKTVAYMGVIPVLVEALKEQQKQLDAQRAELDELKARLQ